MREIKIYSSCLHSVFLITSVCSDEGSHVTCSINSTSVMASVLALIVVDRGFAPTRLKTCYFPEASL
jgi:hypothetical protein